MQNTRHLLVRVQDDVHRMWRTGASVFMAHDRPRRGTVHFTVDGVVADHAYGAFNQDRNGKLKGGVVIIADPTQMRRAAGLGQADTWFRKHGAHDPATMIRHQGIFIGTPTIVAPAGTRAVDGATMVHHNGTLEGRNAAVFSVLRDAGVQPQVIGYRAWIDHDRRADWDMQQSRQWAESLADRLYGGQTQGIHFGPHDSSHDSQIDDLTAMVDVQLSHLQQGDHKWIDHMGIDQPRVGRVMALIDELQGRASAVLANMTPAERLIEGQFHSAVRLHCDTIRTVLPTYRPGIHQPAGMRGPLFVPGQESVPTPIERSAYGDDRDDGDTPHDAPEFVRPRERMA